jgi:A/G-specific adenine glycosylase
VDSLQSLPGIGRSTAAAIVSQALDEPHAILDGNVKRLLTRHAAIEGQPGNSALLKKLWIEAEKRLPGSRGADYTQAVMDLGATLCTARNPICGSCPVSLDCIAYQKGLVDAFPGRKPTKKIPERSTNMLIARNGAGKILLERRPPAGIWGGLWCFPEYDQLEQAGERYDLDFVKQQILPEYLHRFTHFKLTITPLLAECTQNDETIESPGNHRWYTLEQALALGIPKPVRATLESIGNLTE